jgi:hypothetical protein
VATKGFINEKFYIESADAELEPAAADPPDLPAVTPPHNFKAKVDALSEQAPQQFGHLKRHHTVLKRALDISTQNYPTSTQLYDQLDDPPITSQTFGKALPLLVEFEIISLYTTRSNSNRYDVRAYNPDKFARLEEILVRKRE